MKVARFTPGNVKIAEHSHKKLNDSTLLFLASKVVVDCALRNRASRGTNWSRCGNGNFHDCRSSRHRPVVLQELALEIDDRSRISSVHWHGNRLVRAAFKTWLNVLISIAVHQH